MLYTSVVAAIVVVVIVIVVVVVPCLVFVLAVLFDDRQTVFSFQDDNTARMYGCVPMRMYTLYFSFTSFEFVSFSLVWFVCILFHPNVSFVLLLFADYAFVVVRSTFHLNGLVACNVTTSWLIRLFFRLHLSSSFILSFTL